MFSQLDVYSPRLTTAPYTLLDPSMGGSIDTDLIQIRNIEGLDPVEADVQTSDLGESDGAVYLDSHVGTRNIVITVGLNPDWITHTPESIRAIIYSVFTPKSEVRLVFTTTHLPEVEIKGVVEDCVANPFSEEPEYQISIICADPYFTATEESSIDATTSAVGVQTLNYEGTIETGFIFEYTRGTAVFVDGDVTFKIWNPALQVMQINDVSIGLSSRHVLVSTVRGDKYAKMILSSGVIPEENYLSHISGSSQWPVLKPGVNLIDVDGPAFNRWYVKYKARYGGL